MNITAKPYRNETEVESKFIVQYLLPALGYSSDTWYQEVALGSIRLDFLAFATQVIPFVLDAQSPLSLVIEAKSPSENLDKHIWKIKHYLKQLNAQYGILTNGKDFRIYKNIKGNIEICFQCNVCDVDSKIDYIKSIVGRDSLIESIQQDPEVLNPDIKLHILVSS